MAARFLAKKKEKKRNPTVKPREPLNNKCISNEFLWTSWEKKDFRSLQNYVSQGLEWAFHSVCLIQVG